jgi:O-antigen ligase
MNGLARAGWLLSAALFATILSSIFHVDYVGVTAEILLLLAALAAAARPSLGPVIVVAVAPVAYVLGSHFWSWTISWAETVSCAAIAGMSLGFARARERRGRLPRRLSTPAMLFAAIVIASLIAALGVKALRLGPGFTSALVTQLTREYFVDVRGFPGLHAGMLLLEGIILFAASARIARERADPIGFLRQVAAAAALSGTLAAALNIDRLVQAAWRAPSFWPALLDLASRVRFNVHYADVNAAGSYFAMAALVAVALAAGGRGWRRIAWSAAAATIAIGLWLTSSRIAVLAALVAPGAVLMIRELARGRARALRVAGLAAAGVVLLLLAAIALPQRGSQKSSFLAADVRLGLIRTGGRMIASHPLFGIGLGEFYQRSGEFSSPELIAKFPVAVHENAHNNFVQVGAELGIAGGLLFAWIIGAALVTIARGTFANGGPLDLRDPRPLILAAVGAFALTCLGGHPLLIAETGCVFWTLLGATAGAAIVAEPSRSTLRWIAPAGLLAIALLLPWEMRAMTQDADLEHVGIGVSQTWQLSPDGIRYREAPGHATLFVPATAFKISVFPIADAPIRLELTLDGRIANIVTIAPRHWNDVIVPARTETSGARYAALDLRVLDAGQTVIWITKDQSIQ